jgi:hypothetical protein
MPPHRGKAAGVAELVCKAAALFLLFAADYADLVAELAAFFGQGVDVEGRAVGLYLSFQFFFWRLCLGCSWLTYASS